MLSPFAPGPVTYFAGALFHACGSPAWGPGLWATEMPRRPEWRATYNGEMAEREGFEPPCRLPGKTLSRRPRYDHFGTSP